MSACRELMNNIRIHQEKVKLDCPIMARTRCHPKAHFLVHVDGKKRIIFLSCSKCDKLVSVIKLNGRINKGMKLEE